MLRSLVFNFVVFCGFKWTDKYLISLKKYINFFNCRFTTQYYVIMSNGYYWLPPSFKTNSNQNISLLTVYEIHLKLSEMINRRSCYSQTYLIISYMKNTLIFIFLYSKWQHFSLLHIQKILPYINSNSLVTFLHSQTF